jgi:hypothetical protein
MADRTDVSLLAGIHGFKGSLLAYSVEVNEENAGIAGTTSKDQMVEEIIRSIDAVADHEDSILTTSERSTWVAIKLVRLSVCGSLNTHPKPRRRPYFPTLRH